MGDEDAGAELGPGVASHVKHQDAPIDKTQAKNAVLGAIIMTGTSGKGPGTVPIDGGKPTNAPEPIATKEFNSGVAPSVTYEFALGPDGKIYGTADKEKIPPGKVKKLTIKVTHTHQGWVATTDIIDGNMYTGTAVSGAPHSIHDEADAERILEVKRKASEDAKAAEQAELDARTRGDEAGVAKAQADQKSAAAAWSKAETQLAERFYDFFPPDATTAVRQTLVKLQMQGKLYDFSAPGTTAPNDAASATPSTGTTPGAANGRTKIAVGVAVAAGVLGIAAFALAGGGAKSEPTKAAADSAASVGPVVTPVQPTSPPKVAAPITWSLTLSHVQDPGNPCHVVNTFTFTLVNGAQFAGQTATVVLFGLDFKDHPTRTFPVGGDGTFTFDTNNTQCYDPAAGVDNQTGAALVSVGDNTNVIPPTDAVVPK